MMDWLIILIPLFINGILIFLIQLYVKRYYKKRDMKKANGKVKLQEPIGLMKELMAILAETNSGLNNNRLVESMVDMQCLAEKILACYKKNDIEKVLMKYQFDIVVIQLNNVISRLYLIGEGGRIDEKDNAYIAKCLNSALELLKGILDKVS